jgi:alkylhydroperoxidase/carboxymuconolactone decarboxylase family protein YurZ
MTQEILPSRAGQLATENPEIWRAYQALGNACLVKLALAVGVGSEGAVHSHVRRGIDEELSPDELRHVATLAIPTLGFPAAVAALTWIEDILEKKTKR